MPELFQPDIFSAPRPVFSPAPPSLVAAVRDVSQTHYRGHCAEPEHIEQFGGNEINSNNFRLYTRDRQYLLKRLPPTADARVLKRQLQLTMWLQERGIAVPRVIRSDTADILPAHGEFHWCLFEFIAGDFFSGSHAELISTAFAIGRLQKALCETPDELLPPRKWSYQSADDVEVLELARARRGEWVAHFGPTMAAILAECWDRVERIACELKAAAAACAAAPLGACHSDLHPHNLLVADGKLRAFIDFESFALMPVPAALGFACYKLLKQYASFHGLSLREARDIADAARRFCDALESAGCFDPSLLRLMALAEVFRRMLIIFRLNLRQQDKAWNHVLPMHLAGLDEIDVIFGKGV